MQIVLLELVYELYGERLPPLGSLSLSADQHHMCLCVCAVRVGVYVKTLL